MIIERRIEPLMSLMTVRRDMRLPIGRVEAESELGCGVAAVPGSRRAASLEPSLVLLMTPERAKTALRLRCRATRGRAVMATLRLSRRTLGGRVATVCGRVPVALVV